jgi:hypothetical protein
MNKNIKSGIYSVMTVVTLTATSISCDDFSLKTQTTDMYLRHTSENQFVREMWQQCYSGISRANTAIINIPKINMDEGLKKKNLSPRPDS